MNASSSIPHRFVSTVIKEAQLTSKSRHLPSWFLLLLFASQALSVKAQSPSTVVAKVGPQVITQAEVDDSVASQVYDLQQKLFAIRKAALNNLITKTILEQEAARQKLSVDQLKSSWMSGEVMVDPVQVDKLYIKNQSAFGLMSSDEAKEKLRLDLEGQARLKRYRDQLNALREKMPIEVLLDEPRVKLSRATNLAFSKGPANAKVVITEFSDFQCPYCKDVQANLISVLQQYRDEVRLEFKNLPLENHPLAFTAARAAYCGGKQGAFWQFHDALFGFAQLSLDKVQSIPHRLNLNAAEFENCLTSEDSQEAIVADMEEARRLGINGTPSFVINGKLLLGAASVEEFTNAVERELNNAQLKTSTSPK